MKNFLYISALFFAILLKSQTIDEALDILELYHRFLELKDALDNNRSVIVPGYPSHDAAREDTTIVTGFLDIGRSNWSNQSRSTDTYFENAARVMSLKNKMVIFIQPELRERVTALRKQYDPDLVNTTIVDRVLKQCRMYEHRQKMVDIMNSADYKNLLGKYHDIFVEYHNADYDIAMYCKFNMLEDTIVYGYQKTNYYLWMDFGMRPGMIKSSLIGTYFPPTDAIYSNNKKFRINAWERYKELKTLGMQEIVKNQNISLIGGVFGGHKQAVLQAAALFKRSLQEMLHMNIVGDDQNVLDWAYVTNSDIFDIKQIGNWSVILVEF